MNDNGERFGGDLGEGPGRRRVLPDGFAVLPGGPELAAAIASVEPLCPRHHKAKSERDWKLKQTGPGEHTLTDPYGRHYTSGAPSLTYPVTPAEPATATAGTHENG